MTVNEAEDDVSSISRANIDVWPSVTSLQDLAFVLSKATYVLEYICLGINI